MNEPTVLVVDDESLIRFTLRERLAAAGCRVVEADSVAGAIERADRERVDLVLLDFRLPDGDGLTVLRRLHETDPDVPVILMTAHASIENAVAAIKQGAWDYVDKPFHLDALMLQVAKALETTRLRREVRELRERTGSGKLALEAILGDSGPMRQVKEMLGRVARSPTSTVLLTGESGSGKDLCARVLHDLSERADKPFMNITCSAMPEQLLESELFGHERGAFTDARARRKGLLESADGGTVFLDEIGELAAAAQAKLLRFLEEKTFKRVGGSDDVRVDVRVVAATNRDLDRDVTEGRFRGDLYWRLKVLHIALPPLRDRRGDVPLLLHHYIGIFNREFKRRVSGVEPRAEAALAAHPWPGNIRELRNAVERAMLLATGDVLTTSDFGLSGGPPAATGHEAKVTAPEGGAIRLPEDGVRMDELERDLVIQALARTGGNQTRAAALLGLNRDQIRYRIEKFGIDAGNVRASED